MSNEIETLMQKLQEIKSKEPNLVSDDEIKWLVRVIELYQMNEQLLLLRLKKLSNTNVNGR